ncbi:MAG: hypothetical protein IKD13_04415, partial [Firmicutes bacterium]|nr:hypothetical protein [Bacillota bacterium]
MNNREHWSPEELAMQEAMDRISEEYSDVLQELADLSDVSDLPGDCSEQPDPILIRRRKFRRRLIAACFLGVCMLSTALAIFINSDTCHAIKFAMEKKYYQAKGWVQATDPENVNENNMMIVVETDETKIRQYEEFWEPLMYPQYMSNGYEFEELYIKKCVNGFTSAAYTYINENEDESVVITITPIGTISNSILWITTTDVRNGTCEYKTWYDQNTENNGINIIIDNISITV